MGTKHIKFVSITEAIKEIKNNLKPGFFRRRKDENICFDYKHSRLDQLGIVE